MGHEYCGIVEEVGSAVKTVKPGQFVIGSFATSDNTCPHCQYGYQSSCQNREWISTAQAPLLRVPFADGTLVPTPDMPSDEMLPSLLSLSDVMGTGWFAADAANVRPGGTVIVVGDGAVGLLGVLSAKQMGAERIIAMNLGQGPFLLVNPEITWKSDELFTMWDDCMSFPWLMVRLRRHVQIDLTFQKPNLKDVTLKIAWGKIQLSAPIQVPVR